MGECGVVGPLPGGELQRRSLLAVPAAGHPPAGEPSPAADYAPTRLPGCDGAHADCRQVREFQLGQSHLLAAVSQYSPESGPDWQVVRVSPIKPPIN